LIVAARHVVLSIRGCRRGGECPDRIRSKLMLKGDPNGWKLDSALLD